MPSYAPAKVVTKPPGRKVDPRPFDPEWLDLRVITLNNLELLMTGAKQRRDEVATAAYADAIARLTLLQNVRSNREFRKQFEQVKREILIGMRLVVPH